MAKNSEAYSLVLPEKNLAAALLGFDALFQENLKIVYKNFGRQVTKVGRETLDAAETPWGIARMSGKAGGTSFEPYGNSTGRNDSGRMMDAFGYSIGSNGRNRTEFRIGYVDDQAEYFLDQEDGFKNYGRFKGLLASGEPRFGNAKQPVDTKGAGAIPAAYNSIKNRIESAVSAAWNQAARDFGSAPAGTYLQARKAYYDSFTGDELF
jgi:hypothetical protein